ncbi:MAG: ABC transporter ATP-binding protein [Phycisphaerae bacterium]
MKDAPEKIDIRYQMVGRVFHDPQRGQVHALQEIDLTCQAGQLTCVLGPSGCGKTTLLRLAAGLDRPTTGRVQLAGADVDGPTGVAALVSQEGDLLPWRTVLANAELGLEIRGIGRADRRRRALRALRRVGLDAAVAKAPVHTLSGGMRRRVALARALAADAEILLMDEPFAGLDEPTRHRLQAELSQLWQDDRRTVLFVTHNIEEAVFLADRIVLISAGRCIDEYIPDLPRPRDRLSRALLDCLFDLRRRLRGH